MPYPRAIHHILLGSLLVMTLIGMAAAYWAIGGKDTILRRSDNPRLIEAAARIQRGSIYDRHERLLVETANDLRRYLKPSTYSLIGYHSLRYGTGGLEAAFDRDLAGLNERPGLADYFAREILHQPPVGTDVRLTLDARIQDIVVEAMGDYHGAAVVMNAQNGDILALASLPSYDPNSLDNEWDSLTKAAGKPFFNRALQGQYQPGGAMYILWLTQAILADDDLTRRYEPANQAIDLGEGIRVTCVIQPETARLSLVEAFIYGCPAAFVRYQQDNAENSYDDLVRAWALDSPITIAGLPMPEPILPSSDTANSGLAAQRETLGQGDLTATPLHLSGMMAAIANQGNAPMPGIQLGLRPPGTEAWLDAPRDAASIPMITAGTARQLQDILERAWAALQDQTYPTEANVGATVAMSQSGDGTQIWLNGFVAHASQDRAAFVILLEDSRDIQKLIAIGQRLIAALLP